MNILEIFNAKAVATQWNEVASNKVPYLGKGFFPNRKKMGLDLGWIKGLNGLPVSLAPTNFDAKSTLRSREGFEMINNEMAFFRESMLVREADEQEIMRVQSANDAYANEVLARIYDDVNTLLDGAEVVPERMRMQLLCPENEGHPMIVIESKGVTYAYNYDTDGSYAENNYKALVGASDMWTDHANSKPLKDIETALDAIEEASGNRPAIALMNSVTFNHLKENESIRSAILAQNATANIMMTNARVKELISTELGVTPIIYNKMYKDEAGVAHKFFADGFCTLLPEGALGSTWYGVTPEERTLQGSGEVESVQLIDNAIAVVVKITEDPVNTKTTVSEIVLPSYERMGETYVIKAF